MFKSRTKLKSLLSQLITKLYHKATKIGRSRAIKPIRVQLYEISVKTQLWYKKCCVSQTKKFQYKMGGALTLWIGYCKKNKRKPTVI